MTGLTSNAETDSLWAWSFQTGFDWLALLAVCGDDDDNDDGDESVGGVCRMS